MCRWNCAAVENEPDVVRIGIVSALSNQPHSLVGKLPEAFTACVQISRQQQSDPKAAEPIAVAPTLTFVGRGFRCEHREPNTVRTGHIGKRYADCRFILE